jgi:hypothetical protein
VLDAFYRNLYGPGFVYSVDRAFVSSCRTPCLVLAGNDEAHPLAISEEVAKLLPDAELIREWKEWRGAGVGDGSHEAVPVGAHARAGVTLSVRCSGRSGRVDCGLPGAAQQLRPARVPRPPDEPAGDRNVAVVAPRTR